MQLEQLCTQFYVGSDMAQRDAAQKVLLAFDQAPDCISRCKDILDISSVRKKLVWDARFQRDWVERRRTTLTLVCGARMAAILERVGRSAESSQSHSGLLARSRARPAG